MEFRASKLLVPVVGGTVGGVLVIIIFLVVLIIVVCKKTRPELKPNIDDTLGKPSFNSRYCIMHAISVVLLMHF